MKRRPIRARILYRTAGLGQIEVATAEGKQEINYEPLSAEAYTDLRRYLSEEALKLREWLITAVDVQLKPDTWVEGHAGGAGYWRSYWGYHYLIGWPGGEQVEAASAKAAAQALRQWFPLRDYGQEGAREASERVVPIRPMRAIAEQVQATLNDWPDSGHR